MVSSRAYFATTLLRNKPTTLENRFIFGSSAARCVSRPSDGVTCSNNVFFVLISFFLHTVKCPRCRQELSTSSKVPKRANTLCYLPAAKKNVFFFINFVLDVVGLFFVL